MKYEFTGEECVIDHVITLRRIRRCIDGLVGGWIESEENLSQEGSCFVYDSAWVIDHAVVKDNAEIHDRSVVCDLAIVEGNAEVRGKSVVCDLAIVGDEVKIKDITVDKNKVLSGGRGLHHRKVI